MPCTALMLCVTVRFPFRYGVGNETHKENNHLTGTGHKSGAVSRVDT